MEEFVMLESGASLAVICTALLTYYTLSRKTII